MSIDRTKIAIGTVVRYDDQLDATYAVIGIDPSCPWNPYKLLDLEDYALTSSDLRQPRWEIIAN